MVLTVAEERASVPFASREEAAAVVSALISNLFWSAIHTLSKVTCRVGFLYHYPDYGCK